MNATTSAVFLLLLALAVPSLAANAPRIACTQAVHDFGAMDGSKPVEHVFTISNQGDAPLQIGHVRACCGASATIADKLIPPGSNTALKVTLSLSGRAGRQNKSFYVGSNDPAAPYLQLRLVGDVLQPLNVQPRSVDFGILDAGVTTNTEVLISGNPNLCVNVTNVESDAAFIATFGRGAALGAWRIIVRPMTLMPGVTKGKVVVLTDHKDHSRVEIPVTVTVASDIVVVPHEIVMSEVGPNPEPVVRYVALRSRSGKAFEILEVTAPDPDIKISHSAIASGGYRITLANVRPFEDLDGKCLVIVTANPGIVQVTVPFLINHAK